MWRSISLKNGNQFVPKLFHYRKTRSDNYYTKSCLCHVKNTIRNSWQLQLQTQQHLWIRFVWHQQSCHNQNYRQQQHHQQQSYHTFRRRLDPVVTVAPLYCNNTLLSDRFRPIRCNCTTTMKHHIISARGLHYNQDTNAITSPTSRMAYFLLSFAAAAAAAAATTTSSSVAALSASASSSSSSFPTPIPKNVCHAEPSQQHHHRYRFFSSSTTDSHSSNTESTAAKFVNTTTTTHNNTTTASTSSTTTSVDGDAKQHPAKDGDVVVESSSIRHENHDRFTNATKSDCPFYGCPLIPIDVHYNTDEVKEAFTIVRNNKRSDIVVDSSNKKASNVVVTTSNGTTTASATSANNTTTSEVMKLLSSAANEEHATFTLIGYKGGTIEQQINQDRALIVAPYTIIDDTNNNPSTSTTKRSSVPAEVLSNKQLQDFLSLDRILLGVFDGHAPQGETVSEFVTQELPIILANKLSTMAINKTNMILSSSSSAASNRNNSTLSEQDIEQLTKKALSDTFVELDRMVPADPSGGCTASVILQQGRKIYVANVGDSRSFIVSYRPHTNSISIAYISREDKPCIPEERARVEASGGQVYIPTYGTSRVVYHDPVTGAPTGLAMSRSIGDWEAGKRGVIPNPIVDVLDIHELVINTLILDIDDEQDSDSYQVNPMLHKVNGDEDDVYLFAVSASDGMLDYMSAIAIARVMAHSLFDETGVHPITALEHLIFTAAQAWQQAKLGRYRDDISLAVSVLRRPPPK